MSKECKHEEWNPCGNDFYSCRKCGILRTSQQVNLYAEKDRQIADLEAKLAESEKQRQHLKDWLDDEILTSVDHESYYDTINEYEEEVKKLKQQLAEKDKEIERMKQIIIDREETIVFADKTIKGLNLNQNQDKISFAVEQLEKVKEFCNNSKNKVEYEYCPNAWTYAVDKDKLMLEIDNQIEEITHQHEDKGE